MFTSADLAQLEQKKISQEKIEEQLAYFRKGFPFFDIIASASTGKGIKKVTEQEVAAYLNSWQTYLSQEKKVVKFVPASGAASRMFKDLFEFLTADYTTPQNDFEKKFFDEIKRFAFYHALNEVCLRRNGKGIEALIEDKEYKTIVDHLLNKEGLNYGQLPKGLLLFHSYPSGSRTAMEEHLVEGALYACNKANEVNLHFTVSPEHRPLFEQLTREKQAQYEKEYGITYHIDFSEQKSSTDTLAADEHNEPFRDQGKLLFRPGGHGALIENLNDIDGDVIFIKNIDNVVPDSFKESTVTYKKLIAGVLIEVQQKAFDYLRLIDTGKYTHDQLLEMLYFLQDELCIKNPDTKMLEDVELVLYIKSRLNRPIRVCGMVKNEGEPGGGPFLTVNQDKSISLQILESSQIDLNDEKKKAMFQQGTHFNPVDLVCAVKDYQGNKFNLPDYVDKNTGFISLKSKNGKELKALELPGLWNGAMSDWNTLFVEVPVETFNPVKTVNDLLRKEHQP